MKNSDIEVFDQITRPHSNKFISRVRGNTQTTPKGSTNKDLGIVLNNRLRPYGNVMDAVLSETIFCDPYPQQIFTQPHLDYAIQASPSFYPWESIFTHPKITPTGSTARDVIPAVASTLSAFVLFYFVINCRPR